MMKNIYLAGPVFGCTDKECTAWRERARFLLSSRHKVVDPMARDYRGSEVLHCKEIVSGDKEAIKRSTVVLAMAERPSWGTAMEIHFAYSQNIPVIAVCSSAVSPWLSYHATVVPSLEEAVGYIN